MRLSWLTAMLLLATILSPGQDQLIPAGTLLRCTLDEPEISSKTLNRGDPVLCHLEALNFFGISGFPTDVYLAGEFEDFRSPGHFVGKGWIKLSFDRVLLPNEAVPLSAKLVKVTHAKVDRNGEILGHGHPQRDLVGWMLPPLWPVKVFTLPLRGPRPATRGGTSLTLRLMQDLVLPTRADQPNRAVLPAVSDEANLPKNSKPDSVQATAFPDWDDQAEHRSTVLALKDGSALIVDDYWVDAAGRLQLTMAGGHSRFLPVSSIDLGTTVRVNRERGVKFILKSEPWASGE